MKHSLKKLNNVLGDLAGAFSTIGWKVAEVADAMRQLGKAGALIGREAVIHMPGRLPQSTRMQMGTGPMSWDILMQFIQGLILNKEFFRNFDVSIERDMLTLESGFPRMETSRVPIGHQTITLTIKFEARHQFNLNYNQGGTRPDERPEDPTAEEIGQP